MKQIVVLVFLIFLHTSCSHSNSVEIVTSQGSKVPEISSNAKNNNWEFNPKLIGDKVESNLQKSALIHLLQNAFEREIEQTYNFDIFDSDNLELLSFYEYPKFHFGDIAFNAYYAKIDYEDGKYELVFITNIDEIGDYTSLILYEKLNSEVIYSRNSKMNFPMIELSYIYQGKEIKSQQFIVENGLFLDYFINETPINEFWNAEWKNNNTYKQEAKKNQAEYQSIGKITNHLKTGVWKEKRYLIEYKNPVFIIGNCENGLKQGPFSVSIPFPNDEDTLIYSGNYKKGIKMGVWKMTVRDSLIIENNFIPTSYSEILNLKADIKKINKKNSHSIPDKWFGFYILKSAKIDIRTNKIKKFTFYVNIVKDHIYVNVDAANLVDFWCEGDYFITDNSDNFIYCKGICDENSLHDFQLRTENGLFLIKSDFFGFKDWMLAKREMN